MIVGSFDQMGLVLLELKTHFIQPKTMTKYFCLLEQGVKQTSSTDLSFHQVRRATDTRSILLSVNRRSFRYKPGNGLQMCRLTSNVLISSVCNGFRKLGCWMKETELAEISWRQEQSAPGFGTEG